MVTTVTRFKSGKPKVRVVETLTARTTTKYSDTDLSKTITRVVKTGNPYTTQGTKTTIFNDKGVKIREDFKGLNFVRGKIFDDVTGVLLSETFLQELKYSPGIMERNAKVVSYVYTKDLSMRTKTTSVTQKRVVTQKRELGKW